MWAARDGVPLSEFLTLVYAQNAEKVEKVENVENAENAENGENCDLSV